MSPSSLTLIDTDYVVLLLRSTSTDTRVPSAAWVTQWSCQWLMGRCQLNDVQLADGTTQRSGVLVEKCKYLEESGCAGICVHTCKMPTQVSQTSCAYFALCYLFVPGVAYLRPDVAIIQRFRLFSGLQNTLAGVRALSNRGCMCWFGVF